MATEPMPSWGEVTRLCNPCYFGEIHAPGMHGASFSAKTVLTTTTTSAIQGGRFRTARAQRQLLR